MCRLFCLVQYLTSYLLSLGCRKWLLPTVRHVLVLHVWLWICKGVLVIITA